MGMTLLPGNVGGHGNRCECISIGPQLREGLERNSETARLRMALNTHTAMNLRRLIPVLGAGLLQLTWSTLHLEERLVLLKDE